MRMSVHIIDGNDLGAITPSQSKRHFRSFAIISIPKSTQGDKDLIA
jgi:hypothetical protein